ncbi:MAG: oligoribonuclease [Proteobacteria bacterium]|nr:oligoribonuclease [Pseudomonadota bacterium]
MTGLDPAGERIIEAAVLVTDSGLDIVAEGPNLVIHQPESVLAAMDEWNQTHHSQSGLLDRVRASTLTESQAEAEIIAFLAQHCLPRTCPLAGNSIHQDRRFLRRYMSQLDDYLHYRIVDVSTVKELVRRWYPDQFAKIPKKRECHRAMDDIHESLAELRHYKNTVFSS